MRLFIALELPSEAIAALTEVQLAAKARWMGRYVKPEQMHITVKFIGEVDARRGDLAAQIVCEMAEEHPPVRLFAKECGLFGNRQSPGIWVAMGGETDRLATLAKAVDERVCAACGVPLETRNFRPHITLGRNLQMREGEPLPKVVAQSFVANTLTLYKSTLYPDGPIYQRMCSKILCGKAGVAL